LAVPPLGNKITADRQNELLALPVLRKSSPI